MKLMLKESYSLRTNDFDLNDYLKPTAVLDIFQDIAGRQAEMIGLGYEDMLNKGYYWVVIREKITILKNPRFGSKVLVTTWPNPKNRIEFTRNYKMEDEAGNLIAYGSSLWVLISTTTRKISRALDVNYAKECYTERIYTGLNKLPDYNKFTDSYKYLVKYTDLDHNKHLNNTHYADIILNALELDKAAIRDLQIDFINEATLGDLIELKYYKQDEYYYFEAYLADKVIFRAEMRLENE